MVRRTFVGAYCSPLSFFAGFVTTPGLLEQTGAAPPDHLGVSSSAAVSGSREPVLTFLSSRPRTRGED